MRRVRLLAVTLTIALLMGCGHMDKKSGGQANTAPPMTGEARIQQAWQGDYPVARLDLLPGNQRENGVGFINARDNFSAVWRVLKPKEPLPEIDFTINLVLFARNTQYFNRIRIGRVTVKDGVAEVLAMETMSAMPIEEKVAMSLVVVAREGITGILSGQAVIPLN